MKGIHTQIFVLAIPLVSRTKKSQAKKMDSTPVRSKSRYQARSVSFPSRSYPLVPQFNEHLSRLRASDCEATSSSLSSISNRLTGLEDLYHSVNDLLLLPQNQQNLAQECNGKWVDMALDGYLKLLDACAATKEVFSQTKEDVRELHSVVRRKRDSNNFEGFLTSRRKVKKLISQLLKDLKSIQNKDMVPDFDKNREAVAIFSMLKDVEQFTLGVLQSLLFCAVGTKVQTRGSGWSLVSKLMHQKSASCQAKDTVINEFEKVDAAVHSFIGRKAIESVDNRKIKTVQNLLGELELSIQDVEKVLERLLRQLIKTRVSLLNSLNN